MGREIRKVPANWEHPKNENGRYKALFGRSFTKELEEWQQGKQQWDNGFCEDYKGGWELKCDSKNKMTWEEWAGKMPVKEDYMPEWDESELTHIQLYETTSEGTPKTPVFPKEQFEQLCEYAAKNCTTFAIYTATKEEWMEMLENDFVHVMVGNMIFVKKKTPGIPKNPLSLYLQSKCVGVASNFLRKEKQVRDLDCALVFYHLHPTPPIAAAGHCTCHKAYSRRPPCWYCRA